MKILVAGILIFFGTAQSAMSQSSDAAVSESVASEGSALCNFISDRLEDITKRRAVFSEPNYSNMPDKLDVGLVEPFKVCDGSVGFIQGTHRRMVDCYLGAENNSFERVNKLISDVRLCGESLGFLRDPSSEGKFSPLFMRLPEEIDDHRFSLSVTGGRSPSIRVYSTSPR